MTGQVVRLVSGRDDTDKQRALEAALAQIDRAFGKGSVMKLGDKGKVVEIESVSTGSLGLDMALGIGGLPRGRVIEVYGPESSGKTTLALHTVAEVQKAGRRRRLRGRGACARSRLRPEARREPRRPAGVASRTPASRRWRSPTPWCARARWTSS
jgi:predicted ATP-dependent serine protease